MSKKVDMAESDDLQDLVCRICLAVVSNVTTRNCGHTFCKGCLEADNQHDDLDQTACHICKKVDQIDQSPLSEGSEESFCKEKSLEEKSVATEEQTGEGAAIPDAVSAPLDLGKLNLGEMASASSEQGVENDVDGRDEKRDGLGACSLEPTIPEAVRDNVMKIANTVVMKDGGRVHGMAALSRDALVVGYAFWRKGVDSFSVSGEKQQYLGDKVGHVYDIAVLTDGRAAVSENSYGYAMYDSNGARQLGELMEGGFGSVSLCSDPSDNIYAVNGNPIIYIFSSNPNILVPLAKLGIDSMAVQICVTRMGIMITSNGIVGKRGRITVYDESGRAGSSIAADESGYDDEDYMNDAGERLYSAVDSLDRVLVARVTPWSSVFTLTRYTLEGTRLIEQMAFKHIYLPRKIDMSCHCYMVSLAPDMIAFANDLHLYFIKLPA